jgi:ribosomal-protein-alanine N-acetyltransferase
MNLMRSLQKTDVKGKRLKGNKKLIGNIYLSKQDFDTWELGYVFNSSYQGNGYAIESARAVVNYVIKQFNAWRIIAMCNPDNKKSWRLLERVNMRREGYLKQNIYFRTDDNDRPIWQDTYEYGILSSEWITFSK